MQQFFYLLILLSQWAANLILFQMLGLLIEARSGHFYLEITVGVESAFFNLV